MRKKNALITSRSPKGRHAVGIFEAAYNDAHLDKNSAQTLNERGDKLKTRLVELIKELSITPCSYETAREILGSDFIHPSEVMEKCEDIAYTQDQLRTFKEKMPEVGVVRWCRKKGFMLVPGPHRPMSLLELRELRPRHFSSTGADWYANEKFASNDTVLTRWHMICRTSVSGSFSMKWSEQQTLVTESEDIPNVAELAWCVTTYEIVRHLFLLSNFYVRTSSIGSDGSHIDIGNYCGEGLAIGSCWGDGCGDDLGLSAARKL